MEDKVTFFELLIALVTIISSAAGLRLLKLLYKWSYDRRNKLRQEWRGDLIKRITILEAELLEEKKLRNARESELGQLRIENAVLKEKLRNYVKSSS